MQDFEESDVAEQRSASEDLEMLEEAEMRRAAGVSDSSYPLVNIQKAMKNRLFLMGKSTINGDLC